MIIRYKEEVNLLDNSYDDTTIYEVHSIIWFKKHYKQKTNVREISRTFPELKVNLCRFDYIQYVKECNRQELYKIASSTG